MLKKAMASKPAKAASASSRKQATGTSGLSLKELEREERKRKEELDDIHRKRQELSRALKAGNLSRDVDISVFCQELKLKKRIFLRSS